MMRKTFIWLALILAAACTADPSRNWPADLYQLNIRLNYPSGYEEAVREGVPVLVSEKFSGAEYQVVTNVNGEIGLRLTAGIYRVSVSDRYRSRNLFNGTSDFVISADLNASLDLVYSEASPLLIRELYVGGCSKAPKEGSYQSDQYVVLHNNGSSVQYLDSLCFGTMSPYNSTGANNWLNADGSFPSFAPIVTVVWRFPGDGTTFPLAPGEDAIIALRGAIDHTQEYPLSVNLNRPDCFVCYNPTYFPNTTYHPAPGDQIRQDHILDVVIKTGQANANTISINSPTFLIFKAQGMSIENFVRQEGVVRVTPGNSSDVVVTVPWEWVKDAVEVFNGSSTGNVKRLPPHQDVGFVYQMETYKGRALTRRIDEEASLDEGYTILWDTNNSSSDFYETDTPLLRQ